MPCCPLKRVPRARPVSGILRAMTDVADTAADDRPWRPAASGASFVYVFPRPGEDLLKLGMSRDPLARLQSLHPRWYDFFDLDAGWIVATDRVREARAIELRLARLLGQHHAPAPLTALRDAGGDTEWYRGATAVLGDEAASLQSQGYVVHSPLRRWLAPRMRDYGRQLFHWSEDLLQQVSASTRQEVLPSSLEWTLCHGLDALPALGLRLDEFVSPRVLDWHAAMHRRLGL